MAGRYARCMQPMQVGEKAITPDFFARRDPMIRWGPGWCAIVARGDHALQAVLGGTP